MSLSHSVQIKNNLASELVQPIYDFLETVGNIQRQYKSFEEVEKVIRGLVGELENAMVGESLSQYDIHAPTLEYDGKVYRHVLRQKKTYTNCAGKMEVERSLYRAGGKSICPMEMRAGIIEDSWTPSSARHGCYVTALLSPYQGELLFKELGQFQPSKSSLTRLSTRLGQKWDSDLTQLKAALCDDFEVPEQATTISASLDGIMLPLNKKAENGYEKPVLVTNPSDEEKRIYEEAKEKAFYREASCAAINFYDNEGERLKTIRFGRMPESGKHVLKKMIQGVMKTALLQRSDLNIVKIADGAIDNWTFLSKSLLPDEGLELLDFFHASDHLNDAFASAYGKGTPSAVSQYNKYRSLLKTDPGGIEKVLNTLRYLSSKHPTKEALKTELNYFRNNRHRMKYAEAIKLNYPIGSGVTEASCKTLVTQRLKCAGMRWDIDGGQGVLTARSLIQSEQFDSGWKALSGKYIRDISIPDNVVMFRKS